MEEEEEEVEEEEEEVEEEEEEVEEERIRVKQMETRSTKAGLTMLNHTSCIEFMHSEDCIP